MAWIASLDARASKWPTPARFGYLALKWGLVALGAYVLIGLWGERVGLWTI